MRSLPLAAPAQDAFPKLQIAAPCEMEWDKMAGDDRQRFCDDCKLHVWNFAELTRGEALELLQLKEQGERVCARLFKRHDGSIITKDCPVGLAERAWKKARNGSLMMAASLLSVVTFVLGFLFFFPNAQSGTDEELTTGPAAWVVKVKKKIEEPVLMGEPMAIEELGDIGPHEFIGDIE